MKSAVVIALALAAPLAHAQIAPSAPPEDVLVRVRAHFARGELEEARALLLDAYAATPRPDLLFALGQVEFNLGDYRAAIAYYERYLATSPASEQAALAQQAIGAARARVAIVEPPPRPARVREWDGVNTGLVALGGATIIIGAGLATYGHRLGDDRSGTLSEYDRRLDRSLTLQWAGAACGALGAAVIGAAIVRWRVRRVDEPRIAPIVSPEAVGLVVERRW